MLSSINTKQSFFTLVANYSGNNGDTKNVDSKNYKIFSVK